MIYTDGPDSDLNNILIHISYFTGEIGLDEVRVNTAEVYDVCLKIRKSFPYFGGIDEASAFKKVANFVSHFLEVGPIKSTSNVPINGLDSYDLNAVIALDIAIICLEGSQIISGQNAELIKIDKPIYLSNHSYADIIHALSFEHIMQSTHFHLLAVFFEQLVYKTNSHCEYKDGEKSSSSNAYYPSNCGGDDLYGV